MPRARTWDWAWRERERRANRPRRSSRRPCRRSAWRDARLCASRGRSRACRPGWTWPEGCARSLTRICSATPLVGSPRLFLCRSSSSRRVWDVLRGSLGLQLGSSSQVLVLATRCVWTDASRLYNEITVINWNPSFFIKCKYYFIRGKFETKNENLKVINFQICFIIYEEITC